jgi:hypothetical protein
MEGPSTTILGRVAPKAEVRNRPPQIQNWPQSAGAEIARAARCLGHRCRPAAACRSTTASSTADEAGGRTRPLRATGLGGCRNRTGYPV